MQKEKIKIAFIKFGGLASGGTEKYLQTLAANLPKDCFDITYFYCDAAPYIGSDWKHPDTDSARVSYMKKNNIKCVKFNVEYKDVTKPTHDWVNHNLWDVFDENNYDIVQSARAGHPEYPFTHIKRTPIVDSIHLSGMVDNQSNIEAVVHLNEWNKNIWIKSGGDPTRVHVIYPSVKIPAELPKIDVKKELGLENKFIFGMHQREDDGIFSHVPLTAYERIQDENTAFVILGGSKKYSQQAEMLDLVNFKQLKSEGDFDKVCLFINMLDVYAHGRFDGENNSQSIAEAMAFGKPTVSHLAKSNGHVETLGDGGKVVETVEQYVEEMKNLMHNSDYRNKKSLAARARFDSMYDFDKNIQKWIKLYQTVFERNKTLKSDDEWLNGWLEE